MSVTLQICPFLTAWLLPYPHPVFCHHQHRPPTHTHIQTPLSKAPPSAAATSTVEGLPWTTVFHHSEPAIQPKPQANEANSGSWHYFTCRKPGLSIVFSQTSAYSTIIEPPSPPDATQPFTYYYI